MNDRDAADAGRSCDDENRVNIIHYSTVTVRIMMNDELKHAVFSLCLSNKHSVTTLIIAYTLNNLTK